MVKRKKENNKEKISESKKGMSEKEIEHELDIVEKELETEEQTPVKIKASKPISELKKGEKIKIDGKEYEIDSHYVLIDHGSTKEMAIELFDKNDKDYQLRYFNDQVENSLEFYELQEIIYIKLKFSEIEW